VEVTKGRRADGGRPKAERRISWLARNPFCVHESIEISLLRVVDSALSQLGRNRGVDGIMISREAVAHQSENADEGEAHDRQGERDFNQAEAGAVTGDWKKVVRHI